MSSSRVTLRDVAATAGVSRATAGFVLSDAPGVAISEATRARVRETAKGLGYVPHGIARALREGSSRIVVLSIDSGYEGNYSRSFTRGLDDELAAHEYVLLVRHAHAAPMAQQRLIEAISPRAVLRLPDYLAPGHEYDDGGWDGGLAGNVGVQLRYLAERGHQYLAVALPDDDPPLGPVRLRFARDAVRAFRAARPEVTALAAFDDDVALRILAALRDLGLAAPRDLAVIGFDDTDYGVLFTPALTTVHIDAEDHGRWAARVILGLDGDGFIAAPAQVIVRESA